MIQFTPTMRLIGHLKDEAQARTFSGFLTSTDIRNDVEADAGGWAIWVYSEDQIEAGTNALETFVRNPADPRYQTGAQAAESIERARKRDDEQAAKRIRTRDQIWRNSTYGPVTLILMAITLAVTFKIGLNPTFADFHKLAIDDFLYVGGSVPLIPIAVRAGEFWRLLTPIFVHFGFVHVFFNMYMLWGLGTLIEVRKGSMNLLLMTVVIGVLSNWAEYFIKGETNFGGMSGVLYGFFGYAWMRGHFDPGSGLALPGQYIWMMIAWYFLCLTGYMGSVANVVHTAGLILGMMWGASVVLTNSFRN